MGASGCLHVRTRAGHEERGARKEAGGGGGQGTARTSDAKMLAQEHLCDLMIRGAEDGRGT